MTGNDLSPTTTLLSPSTLLPVKKTLHLHPSWASWGGGDFEGLKTPSCWLSTFTSSSDVAAAASCFLLSACSASHLAPAPGSAGFEARTPLMDLAGS